MTIKKKSKKSYGPIAQMCSLYLSRVMRPENVNNKRILFSPLNWGMGHVSRSISLLQQLQLQGCKIVIACDEFQRSIYTEYLKEATYISHPGYPFNFGGKGRFGWDLLKEVGPLNRRLNEEYVEVEQLVTDHEIDVVISDHRYGFRSDNTPSVFVTHQYNLPTKWYEKGVDILHKKLISRFDHVWILDHPDSRLAGKLSETKDEKAEYIGPYSRFSSEIRPDRSGTVLIASGPDIYAQQLIDEYDGIELTVVCNDELHVSDTHSKVTGGWKDKDEVIYKAEKIISRSGYSTIMDLEELGCSFELKPTPGQAEQIYLAKKYGA
jgi:hypothetical protein